MPANEPREIASTLDVRPSDVLLARRIIVVEGDSDRAAFLAWSDTLGASLSGAGVELVPSGGHGGAAQVSRLLDLVYAGTDVRVVLDNGPDTARSKLEIEARHGVPVQLLRRTEIEAYYSPDAVVGWLLRRGTLGSADETAVRSVFSEQPSKATLRTMASRYLNRTYDVVDDGRTIASLMLEREIPGEIKELIYAFVGE